MDIIERILILLDSLGISQTELMRELELSHVAIIHWKKGTKIPASVLQLIEYKYNVNSAWLREGKGEMFVHTSSVNRPDIFDPLQIKKQAIIDKIQRPFLKATHLDTIQQLVDVIVNQAELEKETQAKEIA